MPPNIALFLTLGFIAYLFWRDVREQPRITTAVWLPLIWIFLVATRPASKWLAICGIPGFVSTSVEEGSSLDALIFLILIAMGIRVLMVRQVRLSKLLGDNQWLALFVFYCLLSVCWSDFSLVSFKHWIKILGHPVMAVVILTEPHWEEALTTIVKRCAYVIFPISICWMKYFPALGRRRNNEYGMTSLVGVSESKNELGSICLVFLLLFLWHLLKTFKNKDKDRLQRRREIWLTGILVAMALYSLAKAHSATSALSLILGCMTILFLSLRFVNKRAINFYLVTAIIVVGLAQVTGDFFGAIVDMSGHESTIEGRGRLWEVLLQSDISPIFGVGFESYWLGERVEKLWAMPDFWWRPNEAHNGYLELYLNLGIVGLGIFVCVLFATYRKVRVDLLQELEWGRFEMGCLLAIIVHNWTEAGFRGLGMIFFLFFLISIRYEQERAWEDTTELSLVAESESELVYGSSMILSSDRRSG